MHLTEFHPLVMGLHVPKCAGTSVYEAIKGRLSPDQIFQTVSLHDNYHNGRQDLAFWPEEKLNCLRAVWGHHTHEYYFKLFSQRPLFPVCILREPWARFVSMVRFESERSDFLGLKKYDLQFAVRENANFICNFIVDRFPSLAHYDGDIFLAACRVLSCFNVYFLEEIKDFETDISSIFSGVTLGWANASSISIDGIRDVAPFFHEQNREDIRLYSFFYQRRIKRYPSKIVIPDRDIADEFSRLDYLEYINSHTFRELREYGIPLELIKR